MISTQTGVSKDQATERSIHERSHELLVGELNAFRSNIDRYFGVLLIIELVLLIASALFITPKTWNGTESSIHVHVLGSILLGGLAVSFPLLLIRMRSGAAVTRHVIAAAQMVISALLIHTTGGRIETHFHIFGSLAFIAFYRDWKVILTATAVIGLDHVARGTFWPQSVFGIETASPLRWLEHVGWVAFTDTFLIIASRKGVQEIQASCDRNAELEQLKLTLEEKVDRRTSELHTAIRENEAKDLALDAHALVSITDRKGKILHANSAFQRVSGYGLDELIGRSHSVVNSGVHEKGFWGEVWKTIASGQLWRGEVCNRRKNGELYWVDTTIVPFTDDRGRITKYVSIRLDVTDAKRNRDALVEMRTKLERTNELAKIGGWKIDPETMSLDWTKEIFRLHQVQSDKQPSLSDAIEFFEGDAKNVMRTAIERALNFGEDWDLELPLRDTTGNRHWVRIVGVADHDGGRCLSLNGMMQDVTVTHRAKEALEELAIEARKANEAKSLFLANMSHEIRTPMTAILGYTELLSETLSDPDGLQAVQTIERNGKHLLELISEILDLSKIESGNLEIEQIPISIEEIVRDIHDLMSARANAKGVAWTVGVKGDMPDFVRSDPTRIRQILLNLVGNAIKFTELGSVNLTVHSSVRNNIAKLDFSVEDTGIGMTEAQLAKLFKPFAQADESTTRRFGGTGLGLTISKRLVELLGGSIDFTSEPNVGTTAHVSLELPCSAAITPAVTIQTVGNRTSTSSDRSQKSDGRILSGSRVLLVEDGVDNQLLLSTFLRKAGAEVVICENGKLGLEEALRCFREASPYNVILMDMQMPVMDGYGAARELRKADYPGPIIALTAHAMSGCRQECLDAGCDDYTTKPVNRSKFIELVSHYANARVS